MENGDVITIPILSEQAKHCFPAAARLYDILRTLCKLDGKQGFVFCQRVDAGKYQDYYEVIKRPMTLADVCQKLANCKYSSAEEVVTDVNQIWTNARLYNTNPAHFVRKHADELSTYFTEAVFGLLIGDAFVKVGNKRRRRQSPTHKDRTLSPTLHPDMDMGGIAIGQARPNEEFKLCDAALLPLLATGRQHEEKDWKKLYSELVKKYNKLTCEKLKQDNRTRELHRQLKSIHQLYDRVVDEKNKLQKELRILRSTHRYGFPTFLGRPDTVDNEQDQVQPMMPDFIEPCPPPFSCLTAKPSAHLRSEA